MSKPLVSIILPVYNAQNHIARCLESICAQSWQNIEVIVLNDGSKDQSLPVCEAFRAKDERIVLVDKANSGVSDTRNLGLKLASGKYVQFVDSDDYIDPDFTEHLVTAAEQNHADLVIAPYKMVIPAGASKPEQVLDKLQDELGVMTVARPPEVREYGFLPAGVYTQDEFARHLMDKPASYFYGVLWNKLYRRDLLVDHQIQFTSEVRWAEDLVFNMQYLEYANVLVSIPEAGTTMSRTPRVSATPRSTPPLWCRTRSRCSTTTPSCTPGLASTRRYGRSCTNSWWISRRALTFRPLQGGHRRGQGLLEGCPRGRADPHRRSARALERHAGGAAGNGAGTQCRVEGPARQRPQRISKNNKREAAGACTLRHGFPLFMRCSAAGCSAADGGALLGQPLALLVVQAGCQLLEHLTVVVVQPVQLVLGQHTGHDGRGGDGHEHDRLKAQEGAVLVVGLVHAHQLVLDADAHQIGLVHAGLVGHDHARAHQGGVAAVQAWGPSWTLPTKLTLWPVPQR